MTVEELEAKVKALEQRVRELEDIEAIKKLQRAYGYYLEHWMAEDLIDLFADSPEATLRIAAGEFRGKDAIRRFFRHGRENVTLEKEPNPAFLHQVMQLCGVVHVDPDGRHAKGRWYGFGANAFPVQGGKINPGWMNGVYEVEYIKENGIWKLLKVRWCMTFHAPWAVSFVPPEKRDDSFMNRPYERNRSMLSPTGTPEETQYPSGFICPFHFKNPVSGRHTVKESVS
ncbi:MAG: nuclear transport factor 2 family protein, partial [Dehalococcoidales bacterium]|nr:nuclear transport factor 2 family protein [Dehalococcoidales bacterium]